jgi:small conductance mechanosensitive channel
MAQEQPTNKEESLTTNDRMDILWDDLIGYFTSLDATEIAVNLALTLSVLAAVSGAIWAFRRYLQRGASRVVPDSVAKQVYLRRLVSLALTVLRVAIFLFAVYLVARIWGFDLLSWTASEQGAAILKGAIRVAFVVAAAIAINDVAQLVVNHGFERIGRQGTDRRRALQLNTLNPLLRGVVQLVVIIIAALMILGELGVEIGPLIAGAGVIGIALGFGAQTLVKDFLTGVFLIIEDVVSVGDIVRVGDSGGLVEKMTLRTLQLRDYDGTLHVFPYSEAQVMHNMTKTFSYFVFDVQVAYESDVDRALEIMRQVGRQMQSDESFKGKIVEPLDVAGVDGFGDSGVKLKARFKTLPMEQWSVGREFYKRLKRAYDTEGIQIPYPHVHITSDAPPRAPAKSRVDRARAAQ